MREEVLLIGEVKVFDQTCGDEMLWARFMRGIIC